MQALSPLAVPNAVGVLSSGLSLLALDGIPPEISVQLSSGAQDADAVDLYASNIGPNATLAQCARIGGVGGRPSPTTGLPSGGQQPVIIAALYTYLYALRTGGAAAGLTLLVTGQETPGTLTPALSFIGAAAQGTVGGQLAQTTYRVPPGSSATCDTGATASTFGFAMPGAGTFNHATLSFNGNALNNGGQMASLRLLKSTGGGPFNDVFDSTQIPTSVGLQQVSASGMGVSYIAGDVFIVQVILTGGLGGQLTLLSASLSG